ncbi:hypothetical protein [Francisella frigiditurris]|uniref:Uncharacterized protein n=1 Tax=Francisella frigiditurris TaxID=1542390 RepID=A0A1J0KVF0_9GAMM|nr:hypothetical protein [Francisella frigiditurris]APC97650.1 hypothetical protein KX01_301 [Francisella frigiditurris]
MIYIDLEKIYETYSFVKNKIELEYRSRLEKIYKLILEDYKSTFYIDLGNSLKISFVLNENLNSVGIEIPWVFKDYMPKGIYPNQMIIFCVYIIFSNHQVLKKYPNIAYIKFIKVIEKNINQVYENTINNSDNKLYSYFKNKSDIWSKLHTRIYSSYIYDDFYLNGSHNHLQDHPFYKLVLRIIRSFNVQSVIYSIDFKKNNIEEKINEISYFVHDHHLMTVYDSKQLFHNRNVYNSFESNVQSMHRMSSKLVIKNSMRDIKEIRNYIELSRYYNTYDKSEIAHIAQLERIILKELYFYKNHYAQSLKSDVLYGFIGFSYKAKDMYEAISSIIECFQYKLRDRKKNLDLNQYMNMLISSDLSRSIEEKISTKESIVSIFRKVGL